MKPKDKFVVKGPYYKGFLMHVSSSKLSMVNPLLRIGRCDKKKEAISGSEIGADNSPAGAEGASLL